MCVPVFVCLCIQAIIFDLHCLNNFRDGIIREISSNAKKGLSIFASFNFHHFQNLVFKPFMYVIC